MTDIAHLALTMQQGKFPEWSPRLIMTLGDALRDNLDQLDLLTDAGVDEMIKERHALVAEEYRLREILVAFGALNNDDHATGLLDLVEVLLPPQEP